MRGRRVPFALSSTAAAYTTLWAARNALPPAPSCLVAPTRTPIPSGGNVKLINGLGCFWFELDGLAPTDVLLTEEEFKVRLGSAQFAVPKQWYVSGGFRDVSTETTLGVVWADLIRRCRDFGLSNLEYNSVVGCQGLRPTPGFFWRDGYAANALYWMMQMVVSFLDEAKPGEAVGGSSTLCDGLSADRDRLFLSSTSPKVIVRGPAQDMTGRVTIRSELEVDDLPGEKDDRNALFVSVSERPCSDFALWGDAELAMFPSDMLRIDYSVGDVVRLNEVAAPTRDNYSEADRIDWFNFRSDPRNPDAYYEESTTSVNLRADIIGVVGLNADWFLHWARVALALSRATSGLTSLAYLLNALLLGKYAARTLVRYAGAIVHEYTHHLFPGVDHIAQRCCACTTDLAFQTGVTAELGLPPVVSSMAVPPLTPVAPTGFRDCSQELYELEEECSTERGKFSARVQYQRPCAAGKGRTAEFAGCS